MRGQFELVMIAVIFMLTTMGVMNTMVGRSSMMNQALSKDIRLEDAIELQEDRIYLESAAFTALMEKNVCGFNLDLFDMEQDIEAFNATPSGNHTDAIVGSPENCFDLRQDGDAEWDTACSVSGVGEGFIYFNYTWNETWHAYLDDLDTYPIELRGKYGRSSGGYINMSCWNYTGGEWKTLVEYDGGSGDPIFFATLERDCIPSFDEKAQFRVFLQGALAQEVKMYAQVLVFWRENPYWHAMDYAVGKVNEAAEAGNVKFGNNGLLITRVYSVDYRPPTDNPGPISYIRQDTNNPWYLKVRIHGSSLNLISDKLKGDKYYPETDGRLDFHIHCP